MKLFEHKIIALAIVLSVSFATVGPVFAESVYIRNTVSSYSNSGGAGEDGEDGENGKDGEDGKPGNDGETVISGSGSASVKIKTIVNGETVVDIDETYFGEVKSATSTAVVKGNVSFELSESERTRILNLLEQIRRILMHYVSQLI